MCVDRLLPPPFPPTSPYVFLLRQQKVDKINTDIGTEDKGVRPEESGVGAGVVGVIGEGDSDGDSGGDDGGGGGGGLMKGGVVKALAAGFGVSTGGGGSGAAAASAKSRASADTASAGAVLARSATAPARASYSPVATTAACAAATATIAGTASSAANSPVADAAGAKDEEIFSRPSLDSASGSVAVSTTTAPQQHPSTSPPVGRGGGSEPRKSVPGFHDDDAASQYAGSSVGRGGSGAASGQLNAMLPPRSGGLTGDDRVFFGGLVICWRFRG